MLGCDGQYDMPLVESSAEDEDTVTAEGGDVMGRMGGSASMCSIEEAFVRKELFRDTDCWPAIGHG